MLFLNPNWKETWGGHQQYWESRDGEMIDEVAAVTLTNYFKNHLHLPSSRAEMDRTCERIKEEIPDEAAMIDAIPDLKQMKNDKSSVMWG